MGLCAPRINEICQMVLAPRLDNRHEFAKEAGLGLATSLAVYLVPTLI